MKVLNYSTMGAVFFASLIASAYPAVGDKVEYAGTWMKDPETTVNVSLVQEVVEYQEEEDEFIIKIDKTVDGETKTENKDVDADEMYTPEKWQEIKAACEEKGGALEEVSVPAGAFETCHMKKSRHGKTKEVWLGDVPFGLVKAVFSKDVGVIVKSIELQSVSAP
ncbi:MAG: hypothetical protein AAGB31_16385 [Bdellovibrio sp.]